MSRFAICFRAGRHEPCQEKAVDCSTRDARSTCRRARGSQRAVPMPQLARSVRSKPHGSPPASAPSSRTTSRQARRRHGGSIGSSTRAQPLPPLAGLAVSLKDLFDVEGQVDDRGLHGARAMPPAASPTPVRGAAARRWRRLYRSHQHERIRLLRRRHQPASRHAGERRVVGSDRGAHSRRLDLGRRHVGCRRRRIRRTRLRHRRLDPHPGCAARPGRLQEHCTPDADRGRRAALVHARHRVARSRARCATPCCCTRSWPRARVRWRGGRSARCAWRCRRR